jgi:hypothetical protein
MLSGKNILWGTALYLGTIWALYDMKKITFKDKEELEAQVTGIGLRKTTKGKEAFTRVRTARYEEFAAGPTGQAMTETGRTEFGKKFVKLGYVR